MANMIPPEANWTASSYINADDYNNFCNHIYYISQELSVFYPIGDKFDDMDTSYLNSNPPTVSYNDFPTTDRWNLIEDKIELLDNLTGNIVGAGEKKVFQEGDKYIDYIELNRLTNAIRGFYNLFYSLWNNRVTLPFTLGNYGGIKV